MATVPFADTSEPRYAEIARLMAVSGDWVTPWFSAGVPFWGKPPLSFWTQAVAIDWLGLAEFSARLPGWLAMIGVAALLFQFGRQAMGPVSAWWALVIFATSLLPFVASGAVLTDPFLALGTTLTLVSFCLAGTSSHPFWRYGVFIGMAIGLLAKGPIAAVLSLGVLVAWMVWSADARARWKLLLWPPGLATTVVLVVPWYLLAEAKTPGFLQYFLVGEHFLRFTDPGWSGDLYGSAHERAYGAIWVDTLLAGLPWSLVGCGWLLLALYRAPSRAQLWAALRRDEVRFLMLWALASPVLFTLSGNILWTYVLPSMPALALLLGRAFAYSRPAWSRVVVGISVALVPTLFAAMILIVAVHPNYLKTEKLLVREAQEMAAAVPIYFVGGAPFSARYYSEGAAKGVALDEVSALVRSRSGPLWVAVPRDRTAQVLASLGDGMIEHRSSRRFTLYEVPAP
ncbi:phospholipid carrier-dependent glycosyltransferase [Pseudorhodoferax aquiterrae]|uniref:Phospholipid carrier-dependent glycosyltransferase n=2 Tax=Pseudorhodoferax aquiterrae TaxID=747304 RepID=A0ABQ3G6E5_9BURK|nr:phospholipid carrier-dependent glycosyltransferase [Pseudorhodoferax aquiterrae]